MRTSKDFTRWSRLGRRFSFSNHANPDLSLDFGKAANLFMASEQELAVALGIPIGDVRAYRNDSSRVPPAILAKLGRILVERGKGMQRVGEMLLDDAPQ
jgi:hypothetical protein